MPIYEYQCQDCGFQHEALQKVSDAPLVECPACGAKALQKLISAAGFRLSGSGWYETDFKSGNQKNLSQKDTTTQKDTTKADKAPGKKTESKESTKKTPSASA